MHKEKLGISNEIEVFVTNECAKNLLEKSALSKLS
jgi:hypothetical protein